ncbi:MAG: histidine--tRNA ligase [archaeon]|nr:MAG: histidine--tRNA ligase [archaeon]
MESVKGFRDILGVEALKRIKVKEIIEKWFRLYGFSPIETPIIEYEKIVKGDNLQDEAVSNIFKLKDRGKRALALRYEFTFQLARLLKQNPNLKLPFRRYQIGSVFRDEPVAKGRYREFTQCDIDIIGDSSIKADAEVLAVVNDIFKELKIEVKIRINNKKLLDDLLTRFGISDKEKVLRELDKLDKLTRQEIEKNISSVTGNKKAKKILDFIKKDLSFFTEEEFKGSDEVKELIKLCKDYGFNVEFDASLARGLSYYTGNVFEINSKQYKFSLVGGGRFDDSVGRLLNKQIPAVGLSFGLDRITGIAKVDSDRVKCIVISINQDKESIKIVKELRKNNISCFIMDKISKALEYANKEKIPYVVFIGSEEIKKKKFKLRDMKTGKERFLTSKQLTLI